MRASPWQPERASAAGGSASHHWRQKREEYIRISISTQPLKGILMHRKCNGFLNTFFYICLSNNVHFIFVSFYGLLLWCFTQNQNSSLVDYPFISFNIMKYHRCKIISKQGNLTNRMIPKSSKYPPRPWVPNGSLKVRTTHATLSRFHMGPNIRFPNL